MVQVASQGPLFGSGPALSSGRQYPALVHGARWEPHASEKTLRFLPIGPTPQGAVPWLIRRAKTASNPGKKPYKSLVGRTICRTFPANMPEHAGIYRPNDRPKRHKNR